jgi:hypothetical protein
MDSTHLDSTHKLCLQPNFIAHSWVCVGTHSEEEQMSITVLCKKRLHGLSLRANCTDQATADCRRSDCQLLLIEGATWSA